MKLDELAQNAADELVSAGREAHFTSQPPETRRKLSTATAVAVATMAIALAVGLPAILLTGGDEASNFGSGGTGSSTTAPVIPSTAVAGFLELAGESFSVGDPIEAFSESPMYESTLPDAPTFDTSGYGVERPLTQGRPMVADPDVIDGPAVYIGEVEGNSAFLTQEIHYSEDGEEHLQKCLWIGPSPQICADFGTLAVHPAGEPIVAVWLGVPDGTVAVVAFHNGEPVGWQQPRSRVVIIPVADPGVVLVPLGAEGQELLDGQELQRVGTYSESADESGVTTTQPGS